MRAISLGYHDIVDRPESGIHVDCRPCPGAYALDRVGFRNHLRALAESPAAAEISTLDASTSWDDRCPVFITFDDGAVGACCAADELERFDWRGHFFITTGWTETPGFLGRSQIRDLHQRGHVIGSHTVSHPARMSALTWDELIREWGDSRAELMDIVGADVQSASVAHGYYSSKVAASAAAAGIRALFTSEPSARVGVRDGCLVLGRYSIQPRMSAAVCAAIAGGAVGPRLSQAASWQAKKLLKAAGGQFYLAVRARLLSRISAGATR